MLSMVGKIYHQTTFWNIFLFFTIRFDSSCSLRDNLWNVKSYFMGTIRKIFNCHQLSRWGVKPLSLKPVLSESPKEPELSKACSALLHLLTWESYYKTSKDQVARQDSRKRSPEKDRDVECTYSSEIGSVKMDRPCYQNAWWTFAKENHLWRTTSWKTLHWWSEEVIQGHPQRLP